MSEMGQSRQFGDVRVTSALPPESGRSSQGSACLEGAIIIEGGDALFGRHEIRRALGCDPRDEVDDRSFSRAIVPRGKGITLRLRHRGRGADSDSQKRNHRHGREQDATIVNGKTNNRLHGRFPSVVTSVSCSAVDTGVSPSPVVRPPPGGEPGAPAINQSKLGGYLPTAARAASIFAFTASRLKLAPLCIGGNSIAVIASFSTCC